MTTEDERMRAAFEKEGFNLRDSPCPQYGVWKMAWQAALSAQRVTSEMWKTAAMSALALSAQPAPQEVEQVMNLVDVYTDDFYTSDRIALESAITALVQDRDEWKEATESANERFKLAERKMVEAAPAAVEPVAIPEPSLTLSDVGQQTAYNWGFQHGAEAMRAAAQPAAQPIELSDEAIDAVITSIVTFKKVHWWRSLARAVIAADRAAQKDGK